VTGRSLEAGVSEGGIFLKLLQKISVASFFGGS